MEIQVLPLVPDAVLPVTSPATTRSDVPHGYGVQEQCVPFTAATALGLLVRSPITFGLCLVQDVPPGAHSFRSPVEGPRPSEPPDQRVFYVKDDPTCRFVGNAFTFEPLGAHDRAPVTPVVPGISFFDRNDQLDVFKLHLPYICHTGQGVDTLFLSPLNRAAPFDVLSGLVETDWYAHPVNLVLRKPAGTESVHVAKGEPIAQMVFVERSHRRPELKVLADHARLARELRLKMGEWYRQHDLDRSAYKKLVRSQHGRIDTRAPDPRTQRG